MKRVVLLLAATSLLTLACTEDGNGSSNVTFDTFPDQTGGAICDLIFKCCDDTERPQILPFLGAPNATTAGECATGYANTIKADEDFQKTQASIDAGRIVYNAELAATCINALKSSSCTGFENALDDDQCNAIMVGQVAAGGTCTIDDDCANDGNCAKANEEDAEGTCEVDPALGEACPNGFCADGAYCNNGTCEALKGSGEDCQGFNCSDGLYCDTTSNTCTAQKAAGEACTSSDQCESFDCTNDVCVADEQGDTCDGQ